MCLVSAAANHWFIQIKHAKLQTSLLNLYTNAMSLDLYAVT